ncbi:hypothetical protein SAMN05216311_1222 [Chitinophaga sp. CF418]|nr:hypothetical protein SAMN05216311_1222 [Chitinophaga sp. CF418]
MKKHKHLHQGILPVRTFSRFGRYHLEALKSCLSGQQNAYLILTEVVDNQTCVKRFISLYTQYF